MDYAALVNCCQAFLSGGFSGAIALTSSERVVFAEAAGCRNWAEGLPNRPDTRFGIASGTKIFTALAVLTLMDKGLADKNTLLCELLPGLFPNFDRRITVGQLLAHTSGFRDYFDEEEQPVSDFAKLWDEHPVYRMLAPSDFLPLFAGNGMKTAPGERFCYNNAGYIVLGLVVEKLSGVSYADYVQQEILVPLGLTDSGFFCADRLPGNTALGYLAEEPGVSNIFSIPAKGGPDGGLYTTAADLDRFWRGFGKLLGPETLTEMLAPQAQIGSGRAYGYGVYLEAGCCFITGGDPGVDMFSAWYPEAGLTLTALSNNETNTWPLLREACSLLLA